MIHNYIAALPEISLAAGLLVMALVRLFRSENTPKTFYTLGKFFLAFTLLTTVVFYNRSWLPQIFENNPSWIFPERKSVLPSSEQGEESSAGLQSICPIKIL